MKKMIKTYLIISLLMLIILVLYIDYSKYFNYKKLSILFKPNVEIFSLDTLLNSYQFDGKKMRVYIDSIDGTDKVFIKGFLPTDIKLFTNDSIKHRVQHPTKELFLYSMLYNTNFFFTQLTEGSNKIPKESFNSLKKNYLIFCNSILEIPSFQPLAVNDHVISERIIFTIFFNAYILKYYPSETILLNKLSDDIKQSLYFLMDDRFFTAKTNHGLMQIKALAQVRLFIKDKELIKIIDKILDERILLTLDYFSGEDGAVYEASSSYWHFINKLYTEIYSLMKDNPKLKAKLFRHIEQIETFLNITSCNDGFVQGVGDGYSFYSNFDENDNIVYKFSNNLGGGKWTADSIQYGFQFISLDTPPNVHKLPEDLAFFLYVDEPIFINSGLYLYDQSIMRKIIVNEDSVHGVPYILNEGSVESSSLKMKINERSYTWEGFKKYESGKKITRNVHLIKNNDFIEIEDRNDANKLMYSKFIINPEVNLTIENDTVIFKSKEGENLLKMYSGSEFEIGKQIFPVGLNLKDSVNYIQYSGKKNTIVLKLNSNISNFFKIINSNYTFKRDDISEILLNRWPVIKPISMNDIYLYGMFYMLFTTIYFGLGMFYIRSN